MLIMSVYGMRLKEKVLLDRYFCFNFWKFLYSKLKSCVKLNGGLNEYFDCCIGTRQGCIGSPKIFSLFINDLVLFLESKCNYGIFVINEIPDVLTLMFADDVASFSDTVVRLQKLIDLIAEFCKMVGMELNLDKTKIVVFRNGGPLRFAEKWFYNGTPIEVVSFYKYLGVYFRDVPVSPTPISPTPVSPMICPVSPTPVSPTPISPTPEMFTIPVSPTHPIWMNNKNRTLF